MFTVLTQLALGCPLPIALHGRKQNQITVQSWKVRLKLPGSYIYQELKQGAISCSHLFQRKLVMLSLLRKKATAISTGAALGVADMNERPCTHPPPFPPPKCNSFLEKEAMMEKSTAGLSSIITLSSLKA